MQITYLIIIYSLEYIYRTLTTQKQKDKQLNKKKRAMDLNRHLSREDTQMAN